jgi:hypothetical protein
MIIKSYSIPSPSCVRSWVRPMTPDEIRLMNEQIAKRRAAFLRLLHDPDRVTIKTPPVSEEQDERNSREFPY